MFFRLNVRVTRRCLALFLAAGLLFPVQSDPSLRSRIIHQQLAPGSITERPNALVETFLERMHEVYGLEELDPQNEIDGIGVTYLDLGDLGYFYYLNGPRDGAAEERLREFGAPFTTDSERISAFLTPDQFERFFRQNMHFLCFSSNRESSMVGTIVPEPLEEAGGSVTENFSYILAEEDIDEALEFFERQYAAVLEEMKLESVLSPANYLTVKRFQNHVSDEVRKTSRDPETVFAKLFDGYLSRVKAVIPEKNHALLAAFQRALAHRLQFQPLSEKTRIEPEDYFRSKAEFEIDLLEQSLFQFLEECRVSGERLQQDFERLKEKQELVAEIEVLAPILRYEAREKKIRHSTESLKRELIAGGAFGRDYLERIDPEEAEAKSRILRVLMDSPERIQRLIDFLKQGELGTLYRRLKADLKNSDPGKLKMTYENLLYTLPAIYSAEKKKDGSFQSVEIEAVAELIRRYRGLLPLNYVLFQHWSTKMIKDLFNKVQNNILGKNQIEESSVRWDAFIDWMAREPEESSARRMLTRDMPADMVARLSRFESWEAVASDREFADRVKAHVLQALNRLRRDESLFTRLAAGQIDSSREAMAFLQPLLTSGLVRRGGDRYFLNPGPRMHDGQLEALTWLNKSLLAHSLYPGWITLDSSSQIHGRIYRMLVQVPGGASGSRNHEFARRLGIPHDYLVLFRLLRSAGNLYRENARLARLGRLSDRDRVRRFRSLLDDRFGSRLKPGKDPGALALQLDRMAQKIAVPSPETEDLLAFMEWVRDHFDLPRIAITREAFMKDYPVLLRSVLDPYMEDPGMINVMSAFPDMMKGFERLIEIASGKYMEKGRMSRLDNAAVNAERRKIFSALRRVEEDPRHARFRPMLDRIYETRAHRKLKRGDFTDILRGRISREGGYTAVSALRFYAKLKPGEAEFMETLIDIIEEEERGKPVESRTFPRNSVQVVQKMDPLSFYRIYDRFGKEGENRLKAIICLSGSLGEHWVSIAREKKIAVFFPRRQVSGIPLGDDLFPDLFGYLNSRDNMVVIDGENLVINPDSRIVEKARETGMRFQKIHEYFDRHSNDALPFSLRISANINPDPTSLELTEFDLEDAMKLGARNIGLFRTEFLFSEVHFSENQQAEIYRRCADLCEGYLTVRTFDRQADKPLGAIESTLDADEGNPDSLGIRFATGPEGRSYFKGQLKALCRGYLKSKKRNIRVMFPMIAKRGEADKVLGALEEAKNELFSELREMSRHDPSLYRRKYGNRKIPELAKHLETLPVGIMMETPGSVRDAREFMRDMDFVGIGSNDLTRFLVSRLYGRRLAGRLISRSDPRYIRHFSDLEPIVLDGTLHVIREAFRKGIPVSLCGEMASDPAFIVFLGGALSKETLERLGTLYSPSVAFSTVNRTKALFRWLADPEIKKTAEDAAAPYFRFLREQKAVLEAARGGNYSPYDELRASLNENLKKAVDSLYARIESYLEGPDPVADGRFRRAA